jgi:hypothetical protein
MAGEATIYFTVIDGNFGSQSGVPYDMINYSKIGKLLRSGNIFSIEDLNFIGGETNFKNPTIFSYLNGLGENPVPRCWLNQYDYVIKHVGSSKIWLEDPSNGWNVTSTNVRPPWDSPLLTGTNPPRNPYKVANFPDLTRLCIADWDNGPLPYPNESIINRGNVSVYILTKNESNVPATEDLEFQSKLEFDTETENNIVYFPYVCDLLVYDGRLFALAQMIDDLDNLNFIDSILYELEYLDGQLNIVDSVKVDRNAQSLVQADEYLFIPCIGGKQQIGEHNPSNEDLSSLCAVNISSGLGTCNRPFKGDTSPESLDFRCVAIASTGEFFILCGNYQSDSRTFLWAIYKLSLVNVVHDINEQIVLDPEEAFAGTQDIVDPDYFPIDCFTWLLGMTHDNYLFFANTAKTKKSFEDWEDNFLGFSQLTIIPATAASFNNADIITASELKGYVSSPGDPGTQISSLALPVDPSGRYKTLTPPALSVGGQGSANRSAFVKALNKIRKTKI